MSEDIKEEKVMSKDELSFDILNLPGWIAKTEKALYTKQSLILDTERIIDLKKSQLIVEIAQETDLETNKARFPNKEAREAELNNRTNSPDFKKYHKDLSTLQESLQAEKIQLNFYQNRFSALKTIARILVGRDD